MMYIEPVDNYLVCVDDSGEIQGNLCERIELVKKSADLLTGDNTLEIAIWVGGTPEVYQVDREKLVPKNLYSMLLQKGVNISGDPDTLTALSEYLFDKDSELPITYSHDQLGFVDTNDGLVFLHKKPIGNLQGPKAESEFLNDEEIQSKGSLASWIQVINDEVLGKPPLELALAIAASAPLVFLLRREGIFAEVPIVALVGASSTGKTSTLRLMASLFGSPLEGSGLLKDLNATKTAFFKDLSKRKGFPLLIDEAMLRRDWSISDAIYEIAKGIEKATCTSTRKLNERSTFSGTVVLTSEKDILADGELTEGKLARFLELNFPWFDNADHAMRVNRKVNANFGTAAKPYMEYVVSNYLQDNEFFNSLFEEELNKLDELGFIKDNIERRLMNIYATIIVAAHTVNEALGLNLDVARIRDLLVNNHMQKAPVESQALALYEHLMQKIHLNASYFPIKGTNKPPVSLFGRMMGQIEDKGDQRVVFIMDETFNKFALEKFANYTTLVPILADKGMMLKDKHRHYKFKRTFEIGKVPCYGLIVNDTNKKAANTKLKKKDIEKSPNMVNLLSNEDDDTSDAQASKEVANE